MIEFKYAFNISHVADYLANMLTENPIKIYDKLYDELDNFDSDSLWEIDTELNNDMKEQCPLLNLFIENIIKATQQKSFIIYFND
jgi:hypothetical protein